MPATPNSPNGPTTPILEAGMYMTVYCHRNLSFSIIWFIYYPSQVKAYSILWSSFCIPLFAFIGDAHEHVLTVFTCKENSLLHMWHDLQILHSAKQQCFISGQI